MSKYRVKGLPPIKLENLLKKRKTNLKQFLKDTGIASYVTLLQKSESMGVAPPTEEVFKEALGEAVSSPQEGVIVLESPKLLSEHTGQTVDVDEFTAGVQHEQVGEAIEQSTDVPQDIWGYSSQKKKKK